MGGVGDFLFGSQDKMKVTGAADLLTPAQKNLFNSLVGYARENVGTGVPAYGGQLSAASNPLLDQSREALSAAVTGEGLTGEGQEALSGLMSPFDPAAAAAAWKASVADPMTRTWETQILPKIRESFIGRNAGSSGAANRAVAESGANLASELSGNLAKYLFDAGEAQKNRALSASRTALDYVTQPASLGLSAGETQRKADQDALSAQYAEWLRTQPQSNPALELARNLLGVRSFLPLVEKEKTGLGGASEASDLGSFLLGSGSGDVFSKLAGLFK